MSTLVTIFQGGTGANTAADARTNLGVAPAGAENTVTVSQNNVSTLSSKRLNFVNTSSITINVSDSGNGNANIAFNAGFSLAEDTTNTTRYITFADANAASFNSLNVASTKLYFNPNTGILSATTFNSLSDENEKENVVTISNAVETVKQIRGVRFDWKENKNPSLGVIAQELEKILPELVLNSNGQKTVNYSGIIAVLIEAIKEQQEEIEKLKNGSSTNR